MLGPRGSVHVPAEFTREGIKNHIKRYFRVFLGNLRAVYIRLNPQIYGIYGTSGFLYFFGGFSTFPLEIQIHNQEAGPSQGPSERFALNSALEIGDPALVMA